jgi:ABC-type Zn uptake system ZnuABC Zn-binding protein ZnuA
MLKFIRRTSIHRITSLLLAGALALVACSQPTGGASQGAAGPQHLKVVATTTILGDVIHQIGGDALQLSVLLPAGADPHSFEPAPQDIAAVANADLLFVNGAGLETFLNRLLQNAGGETKVITASDGIQLRQLQSAPAGQEIDPHVWFDPNNILIWTQNIQSALSEFDPANAATYAANADAYRQKLHSLDAWIQEQVALVPPANRKLVTDHEYLGYFAERYGFDQVGAVIPSFSDVASPSPEGLAALEDAIRQYHVPAIFVGTTVNPQISQSVASDTGIRLVSLYTESLTPPGGQADTYLKFMNYDVTAIVNALK